MKRTDTRRGLPSLAASQAERRRALIAGKVRVRSMPPQFWLGAAAVLGVVLVVYWWKAERELADMKRDVLRSQRAVLVTLGPELTELTRKVEGWAEELAGSWSGNELSQGWDYARVSQEPGVYLRVRLDSARDTARLRRGATSSLHDGFSSCFFRSQPRRVEHPEASCVGSSDCAPGLLCNEYDVCAPPPRPFNLRLAYRALRVLSSEWMAELEQAGSDLAVTAFSRDLDSVTRRDVPVAIDLLRQARFVTIVLDEDPEGGVPPQDPESPESPEERVLGVPHWARVGVWRLEDGRQLLRFRGRAEGRLLQAHGADVVLERRVAAARARQAHSCALAVEVQEFFASSSRQRTPQEPPVPDPAR